MSLQVIGKATIDMEKFRAFRKEEREKAKDQKCWPAALWKDYFYEHQDLFRFAEAGYSNFYGGLNYSPADSFDQKVEAAVQYMETMGLTWELMFTNEIITILRFGSLEFGIPSSLVKCQPYTDLDQYTVADLRLRLGTEKQGLHTLVPAGDVTRAKISEEMESIQEDIQQKMDEIQTLKEEQRQEIERIKREVMAKYQAHFDLIEKKKAKLEETKARLETQLFVLDTELYAIRCFIGEVITFVPLRSGKHSNRETPVILYQKLRYLDEEMGKYLAIYGFDGNDTSLFEDALRYRDDLFDLFAPPEKSITLVRVSRNQIQYGDHPVIANMLKAYETYHGSQVGILLRDGENLWIGWTDMERIHIKEDIFLKPQSGIATPDDTGLPSTKEEIASRYFVFSILQGVISHGKLIQLPDGCSIFKGSPYICLSMADGWLEDNRFGTFSDIVARTNQPMQVGDTVLTTLHITRDDVYGIYSSRPTYNKAWHNNRGRGDKNRTHDAEIPDKEILPVNYVEKKEEYSILYDQYRCLVKRVPMDKEGYYTYETKRTNERIGCASERITLWDGYYEGRKDDRYDLRGFTDDEIYKWYLDFNQLISGPDSEKNYIDANKETGYYEVPKGIRKEKTTLHYYLSAEKSYSNARANLEIMEGEYLNLTYLNSVYILYAIQNRKIGGWTIGRQAMDYANSIVYLNIALEYLREREKKEAEMLSKYMDLYPDWQVDLSEWRLKHQYHRLTDARAKKFAKYIQKERSGE